MIKKFEHIGVMVKDLDVSIKFYTEVLGMKLVDRIQVNEELELGFISFPGSDEVQIELINRGHDEKSSEGKVDHIAFTVSDIEAEAERLKKLDVRLIDEAPREFLEGIKIFFFYGPDGERLEFFQRS